MKNSESEAIGASNSDDYPQQEVLPSLSSSCVKKPREKMAAWNLLAPGRSYGHFFLAVFFRVTHDGLRERESTRSLDKLRRFLIEHGYSTALIASY